MSLQAPTAVVMIRPHHFRSNSETMQDNAFQQANAIDVSAIATAEFDHVVATLHKHGITVHDFDDKTTQTPDNVFPNNWFSTHSGGHVAVYPTLETAGGSVRCMIAGIHLARRPDPGKA